MSKRKRKERIMSESTQLSITEFMEEEEKSREIVLEELPKIKLEHSEKKNELEFVDKEKDKN